MSKATRRFIVNKVLEMLITLAVVTLISFLLVRLSPIDPAEAYARRSFAAFSFTDEQMEALREDMGLNDPLPVQYVTWVRDALHLDFGKSFVSGQPVFEKVTTAIGITVTIVLISAVIQAVFILLFGCLCYLTRKRMIGHALIFLCIAGVSIPSFFFASTYLDIFAVKLGLTSVAGNTGLMRYLPAAVCIGIGCMGMFSGMMYCADCGSILYQCRATGFRKDQEYYICSGYRKGKQVCGTPHSIRTVILEELILQNLREIVSFARSHENRFAQMVMDMDVKERNKGLAKKRKLLSEGEKRITELDMIFKRLYEDNISGKLTDERFHKLSTDYEAEQAGLQTQAAILREEIEEVEGKSANVDRFLSVVRQYTDIPELTPRILHEFVEKIIIHAATDPHSKINRRQEVDIYYKGIGILEMSKVYDSRQK